MENVYFRDFSEKWIKHFKALLDLEGKLKNWTAMKLRAKKHLGNNP